MMTKDKALKMAIKDLKNWMEAFPYISQETTLEVISCCKKALQDPNRDWEIYHEPKPDIVQFSVEYEQGSGYYSTLNGAKEAISPNCIGHTKRVICGETGKIKSTEVVE